MFVSLVGRRDQGVGAARAARCPPAHGRRRARDGPSGDRVSGTARPGRRRPDPRSSAASGQLPLPAQGRAPALFTRSDSRPEYTVPWSMTRRWVRPADRERDVTRAGTGRRGDVVRCTRRVKPMRARRGPAPNRHQYRSRNRDRHAHLYSGTLHGVQRGFRITTARVARSVRRRDRRDRCRPCTVAASAPFPAIIGVPPAARAPAPAEPARRTSACVTSRIVIGAPATREPPARSAPRRRTGPRSTPGSPPATRPPRRPARPCRADSGWPSRPRRRSGCSPG